MTFVHSRAWQLGATLTAALLVGLTGVAGGAGIAHAYSRPGLPVETLMVPSAAVGRDIPVRFQGKVKGHRARTENSDHTAFKPEQIAQWKDAWWLINDPTGAHQAG